MHVVEEEFFIKFRTESTYENCFIYEDFTNVRFSDFLNLAHYLPYFQSFGLSSGMSMTLCRSEQTISKVSDISFA